MPFSTSLIEAKSGMYDTGFYELDTLTRGRYLVIRRNGLSLYEANFNLNHLLAYETPNILQKYEGIVVITDDTSPSLID